MRAVAFPPESRLAARLAEASFHDAYEAPLDDAGLTPIEIAQRFLRGTPAWVEALLAIRNRMVAPLGIRDVGALGAVDARPAGAYAVGDRLSFFEILVRDDTELILGADDAHLDVRVSVLKRAEPARYVLSSWVRTHNATGRLYMIPVGPMHKLIVRSAMRELAV